jgi:hypothetical protein
VLIAALKRCAAQNQVSFSMKRGLLHRAGWWGGQFSQNDKNILASVENSRNLTNAN